MNEFIQANRKRFSEFLDQLIDIEEIPSDSILLAQPQPCSAEKMRQRKVALIDLFSRNSSQIVNYLNGATLDEQELAANLAKLDQLREFQGKLEENSRKEVVSSLGNHRRPVAPPPVRPPTPRKDTLDYKKKRTSVMFTSLLNGINNNIGLPNFGMSSSPSEKTEESDKLQHVRDALKDWYGADWERVDQHIKKKEEKEEKLNRSTTHAPTPVLPLSGLGTSSPPLLSPSSSSSTSAPVVPKSPKSSRKSVELEKGKIETFSSQPSPGPANVVVTTFSITAKDSDSSNKSQFVPASNVTVVSNTTSQPDQVRVTAFNSNFTASLSSRRLIVHAEKPTSSSPNRNFELSRKRHTSMQIPATVITSSLPPT
jgi:hypothetical protein